MSKIIKEFFGNSSAKIYLMQDNKNSFYIKKIFKNLSDVKKTIRIYENLNNKRLKIPEIYSSKAKILNMEYINGFTIPFLFRENSIENQKKFSKFIYNYFLKMDNNYEKDYSFQIKSKIKQISENINKKQLVFSLDELYKKIPKKLTKNLIHGDVTFDNIIYCNNDFFLIDPSPSSLDSVFFEFNKLMQDIKSYWFCRKMIYKTNYMLICQEIEKEISPLINRYYNLYLHIFMLLRVLPYCKENKNDEIFLLKEINSLWK